MRATSPSGRENDDCSSSLVRLILPGMGQPPDISEMYRPPSVDVNWAQQAPPTALPAFYVVAPAKFIVLFVGTMGFYQLYWFYAHFRRSKQELGDDSWPVARTIFAVFFTHILFRRIASRGVDFNADSYAATYVILAIAGRIVDRITQSSETFGALDLLGLALGMCTLYPLYVAQKAANEACGDPAGKQNSRLSVANLAWCGLGMLIWALALMGMVLPESRG